MRILPTLPAMLLLAMLPVAGAPVPVESIEWLAADTHKAEPGKPNDGMADKLVSYMQSHWPQVRHQMVTANAKRSWQVIAAGQHACTTASARTPEREKQAYFVNTLLAPPVQLIVRRDKLAALRRNAAGEVDLAKVLAQAQLRGALVEGRSYGDAVDRVLAQRPGGKPTVALYPAADFGSQLLAMVGAGRADYTIDYAADLAVDVDHVRLKALLVSVPIQGASEPLPAGIACPRNEWGLAAALGIDKVLGTPAGAAMLRNAFQQWGNPDGDIDPKFNAQVERFYQDRAKPSLIR